MPVKEIRSDTPAERHAAGRPRLFALVLAGAAAGALVLGRVAQPLGELVAPYRFSLLVLAAAASFTIGGIFMKLADGVRDKGAIAALLVCFATGAILQSLAMRGEDLGVTYIVVLGVEAALAFVFGWLFFAEAVTALKLAGVVAIVLGIVALRA